MAEVKKLTKKYIISKMPKGFKYSHHNGLPLDNGWYVLLYSPKRGYILRTKTGDPALNKLRKHFKITYIEPFWGHWDNFLVELKRKYNNGK